MCFLTASATISTTSFQFFAPRKSKWIAVLAAWFGGWFGLHKFYLGRRGAGIVSLALFWTGIPFLISIVEWIIYASMDPDTFYEDYELDERAWF